MERYIGNIVNMPDPSFDDIEIHWMSGEYIRLYMYPFVWFTYRGRMYYAVTKVSLTKGIKSIDQTRVAHDFDDVKTRSGKYFDHNNPGPEEWSILTAIGLRYYELDYEQAIANAKELDDWCDIELEFIKAWNRESKIDRLLD